MPRHNLKNKQNPENRIQENEAEVLIQQQENKIAP